MFSLFATMFLAGLLTILLPCILPLLPIVLGVSIAGRSRLRPLFVILGMIVSFVGFTFFLIVLLNQFPTAADYIRISTYYALFLFGTAFLTSNKNLQLIGIVIGGFFYEKWGWIVVTIAETLGWVAMELGTRVAGKIQQFGSDIQQKTQEKIGVDNPIGAFLIGLTLGLVWVPCAGPALSFALTLVREQPGSEALLYLLAYALGTAVPLLIVGYGGQWAVHSVRALGKYTGKVKQIAGALLILTAVAFQYNLFENIQIFLVNHTPYGNLGVDIETRIVDNRISAEQDERQKKAGQGSTVDQAGVSSQAMVKSNLPKMIRAPEFAGLGTWHNGKPLTLKGDLKGKVVLVDFWTYSCINCIRTLPHIQGYWDKFNNQPFVVVGIHTPEFVFEKDDGNVAEAIKRFKLTYPVAQDNDFGTWNAFSNRYWPAKYLIDADGYIRYTHFGEGGYEETDAAIASLLGELGVQMPEATSSVSQANGTYYGDVTPETYLSSRSWPAFGNSVGNPSDQVVQYKAPDTMTLHKYYFDGSWQLVDDEREVLASDTGEIRMKFLGGEINLVMGLEPGAMPASVEVWVDGKKTKDFTVDFHSLYQIFKGEYGEHDVIMKIKGKGVGGYAFTFGQ